MDNGFSHPPWRCLKGQGAPVRWQRKRLVLRPAALAETGKGNMSGLPWEPAVENEGRRISRGISIVPSPLRGEGRDGGVNPGLSQGEFQLRLAPYSKKPRNKSLPPSRGKVRMGVITCQRPFPPHPNPLPPGARGLFQTFPKIGKDMLRVRGSRLRGNDVYASDHSCDSPGC